VTPPRRDLAIRPAGPKRSLPQISRGRNRSENERLRTIRPSQGKHGGHRQFVAERQVRDSAGRIIHSSVLLKTPSAQVGEPVSTFFASELGLPALMRSHPLASATLAAPRLCRSPQSLDAAVRCQLSALAFFLHPSAFFLFLAHPNRSIDALAPARFRYPRGSPSMSLVPVAPFSLFGFSSFILLPSSFTHLKARPRLRLRYGSFYFFFLHPSAFFLFLARPSRSIDALSPARFRYPRGFPSMSLTPVAPFSFPDFSFPLSAFPSSFYFSLSLNWYCIHTAPKQENKVAQILQREVDLEVFAPRIRFRRMRAGSPLWTTEALFPGYLFARFDYLARRRQINAIPGVTSIVHFGDQAISVDNAIVAELRAMVRDNETIEITAEPTAGDEVVIASGPMSGLRVLVTRVLPARQRIAVLLELLGTFREVEIEKGRVLPTNPRRS
jgi:transcriptional antiterminator RfaH